MSDATAMPARPEERHATRDAARAAFLSRYEAGTRALYESDLRIYFDWCDEAGIDAMAVKRFHLEEFRRHLEGVRGNAPRSVRRRLQTLRTFYRLAVADELIDRDPTILLRLPEQRALKRQTWMDRWEVQRLLAFAEAESPDHHALVSLMTTLGMRVSAACNVRIEDFHEDASGYLILRTIGKGGKLSEKPVPVPMLKAVAAARGDRSHGPLIRRRDGRPQDRNGAYAWMKILCRKAGLPETLHPHSCRRSAITLLLDKGAALAQVQGFADHAHPSTTMGYNSRGITVEAHPAHLMASLLAA